MTTAFRSALHTIFWLAVLSFLFSSCFQDQCLQSYDYKMYKPVYLSYDLLRTSVKSEPAREIENAGRIYYKQPYIFINEVNEGIHVIDNSNPSSPQNISFINIPGCLDLSVKDNMLYADSYIDLIAIDISDPANISVTSRVENIFPQRTYDGGFTANATFGVVTNWVEVDTTITTSCVGMQPYYTYEDALFYSANASSLTTGSSGGFTTTYTSPGIGVAGSLSRFALAKNFLYCLSNSSMQLFDVTNASNPLGSGSVSMPWTIETISPFENYLFIGANNGVYIYNNSNPSSPQYVSEFTHVTSCDPVVATNDYAYSTLHSGTTCGGILNELDVIDISNISSPIIANSVTMSAPYGLGVDGQYLFICDNNDGLKMYKLDNPEFPSLSQTVSLSEARDVICLSGLLLVISNSGLYEFDYTSGTLQQLSFLNFN